MSIQTIDPNTNKLVKSFEEMTDVAVNDAVAQAEKAFAVWRKTTYKERAQLLNKVAQLLRREKNFLAEMITLEMGKLISQAEGEIDLSADIIEYYANHGARFLADKPLDPEDLSGRCWFGNESKISGSYRNGTCY